MSFAPPGLEEQRVEVAAKKIPNKRLCAFIIDIAFIQFVNLGLLKYVAPRLPSYPIYVPFVVEFLYLFFRDGLFGGRSLGKLIIGLYVVDQNDNGCGFGKSFQRNIIFGIPVITLIIEYFVMAYSKNGRRLGDHFAKTKVLDDRPRIKDGWFLLVSIFLILALFVAEPAYRFAITSKEINIIIASLEDYKVKNGEYPKRLDGLGIKIKNNFIYTTYHTHRGESEFFLTGVVPPAPPKITYSSQLKEWKIHRESVPWTKQELGIDENSTKSEEHYNKGVDLEKEGSLDQALLEYREAARLKPDFLNARLGLAFALKKKGLPEDAIKEYQEAIKINPNNVEARLNLYIILFSLQRDKDALEAYRNYIRMAPPKNEEEAKQSKELIKFMEQQVRAAEQGEVSQQPSAEAENAVRQIKEFSQSQVANLRIGKSYVIYLKNGQEATGTVVAIDPRGIWLEVGQGARVYFTNDEIKSISE